MVWIDKARGWLLAGLLCFCLLPSYVMAQTEGPLKIKPPRSRPVRSEPAPPAERAPERDTRPSPAATIERPVLKRKEEAPKTESGPCPAGYIAVPVAGTGDERPPRLTRGNQPAEKTHNAAGAGYECIYSETVADEEGHVISEQSAAGGPGGSFLDQVRLKVFRFTGELPDFICDQVTARFTGVAGHWKLRDRIQAQLLYIEGKEQYDNIRRNGKKIRDPQSSGAWSTGEFGTLMKDVFHPESRAVFKETGMEKIGGVNAKVFDLAVEQRSSHWRVDFEGSQLYPGYTGRVWIDPDRMRVLRIEMQATDIPRSYPLDTIETAVDYGSVEIGGTKYLLPVKSANLACSRRSGLCSKNELEFENYRKFAAESTISTVDTDVTFEGDRKQPEP